MANYYEAYDDGHTEGVKEGFKSGAAEGYTKGHAEGAQSGYAKGYEEGYTSGYAAGGGGASSEWKYQTKSVIGYGGSSVGDFLNTANVLYAPNAEGGLGDAQFALTEFNTVEGVVLDFPKAGPDIGEKCFSGMTTAGEPATVSSGNFPEVTDIQGYAFASNRTVTADFPKCTFVGLEAFHMHDYVDQSGHPVHATCGSLSFPAMTPMWACFPAISGTYDDEGTQVPYHVGPKKVPVIPIDVDAADGWDYPSSATRIVSAGVGPTDWHWGSPGSGAEVSTDITWSGTSCGRGFRLSYEAGTGEGDAGSGHQVGPFGRVLYRNEGGSDDQWQDIAKESKFNVSLPNISVAAAENTLSLQQVEVVATLPPCGAASQDSTGISMHLLGLADGSTIVCSDGVYTV